MGEMNMLKRLSNCDDALLIDFQQIQDIRSELIVIAHGEQIPIPMERIFYLRTGKGVDRGNHAHYQCTQVMNCVNGSFRVNLSDGKDSREVILSDSQQGLLVPPGIWVNLHSQSNNGVLLVICDHPYDEDEYIRDHTEYLAYRREHGRL